MKYILTFIVVLFSIIILISGNVYWHHKINLAGTKAKIALADDDTKTDKEKDKIKKINSNSGSLDIEALTQELPVKLKEKIVTAYEEGKGINMVVAGGSEINGLVPVLQKALDDTYGAGFIQLIEANFGDRTSLDVYRKQLLNPFLQKAPDVILYTPLLRHDLGKVSRKDSVAVVRLLNRSMAKKYPKSLFVVQPPNPIANGQLVENRVQDIADYVDSADIAYLDVWSSWPTDSDELSQYLNSSGKLPNEKGIELWVQSLSHYFTGE